MKRIILFFCIFVLFLTSCQKETTVYEGLPDENISHWITHIDTVDIEGMELYWQQSLYNYFPKFNDAKLSIYVTASQDDDGEWIWNDGHEWMLTLETSFGYYPLYSRGFIQFGGLSCAAYVDYDDGTLRVLITEEWGAGYYIHECTFDNDKDAFKIETIYETKGSVSVITSVR